MTSLVYWLILLNANPRNGSVEEAPKGSHFCTTRVKPPKSLKHVFFNFYSSLAKVGRKEVLPIRLNKLQQVSCSSVECNLKKHFPSKISHIILASMISMPPKSLVKHKLSHFIICWPCSLVIIRTFQLVFSAGTVFFSHNKSAETVFCLVFSTKRTWPQPRPCLVDEFF